MPGVPGQPAGRAQHEQLEQRLLAERATALDEPRLQHVEAADLVEPLLDRAASRGREVRVFGELVALLWTEGRPEAALRLADERLYAQKHTKRTERDRPHELPETASENRSRACARGLVAPPRAATIRSYAQGG